MREPIKLNKWVRFGKDSEVKKVNYGTRISELGGLPAQQTPDWWNLKILDFPAVKRLEIEKEARAWIPGPVQTRAGGKCCSRRDLRVFGRSLGQGSW